MRKYLVYVPRDCMAEFLWQYSKGYIECLFFIVKVALFLYNSILCTTQCSVIFIIININITPIIIPLNSSFSSTSLPPQHTHTGVQRNGNVKALIPILPLFCYVPWALEVTSVFHSGLSTKQSAFSAL